MTDAELERRLDNWAAWRRGEVFGPGGYPRSCIAPFVRGGYRGDYSCIPILGGEAFDTDAAIGRLKPAHRAALEVTYMHPDLNKREAADALGIHRDTLADRIVAARAALRSALGAKRVALAI